MFFKNETIYQKETIGCTRDQNRGIKFTTQEAVDGSKGAAVYHGCTLLLPPVQFLIIFMQFSGEIGQNNMLALHL